MGFLTENVDNVMNLHVVCDQGRAGYPVSFQPYMCAQKQRSFWGLNSERRAWGFGLQVGTDQER